MHLRAPAIMLSTRNHGETAVIARMLTEEDGMVAGYVAGGRGRRLRPIVISGNLVAMDLRAKSDSQLPFAKLELISSRGPWLNEPLPAAAIGWVTALTASTLPERNAYPAIFAALSGLLEAICHAPSARAWLFGMLQFEALMLRELGYGAGESGDARIVSIPSRDADLSTMLERFDAMFRPIEKHLLAGTYGEIMSARNLLRSRLARIAGGHDADAGGGP
ncbi:MAG: recombination protein O N-terminal domain-containing protein [Pontixanthobacter sp.]